MPLFHPAPAAPSHTRGVNSDPVWGQKAPHLRQIAHNAPIYRYFAWSWRD